MFKVIIMFITVFNSILFIGAIISGWMILFEIHKIYLNSYQGKVYIRKSAILYYINAKLLERGEKDQQKSEIYHYRIARALEEICRFLEAQGKEVSISDLEIVGAKDFTNYSLYYLLDGVIDKKTKTDSGFLEV